jgi:hypothetical protein
LQKSPNRSEGETESEKIESDKLTEIENNLVMLLNRSNEHKFVLGSVLSRLTKLEQKTREEAMRDHFLG